MKKTVITLLLFFSITTLTVNWLSHSRTGKRLVAFYSVKREAHYSIPSALSLKLQSKAIGAKAFVKKKSFNTEFCFLIDMSLPSYQKRFFIYDFKGDSIINSGLVTHGRCNEYWLEGRKYGNTPGCGCTSLGKYKIGNSYQGRFGLAFKLYGLDKTNDKAFERFVVLHAHNCVPETEVSSDICQSDGCPTVAPGFLKQLEPSIKGSRQPVLLWIFN
jgi:hypothetical protein